MTWINKKPRKLNNNSDRQKEKHRLYASKEWQALRLLKLQENPMCEYCNRVLASEVHHKDSFMKYPTPELRRQHCIYIDLCDLMSLCSECHQKIHEELRKQKKNT